MALVLTAWKFTEDEKALALKIVNATINLFDEDITFIEGQDLLHFGPEKDNVVVAFGPRPEGILKQKTQNLILLPLLSQLIDLPENVKYRKKAWDTLKAFKIVKDPPKEVELTSKEIIALYELATGTLNKYYMQFESVVWSLTTETGMTIAIVKDINTTLNTRVDFVLTFEEILAAKAAVDVLALNKLLIVKGKKENVK